MLVAVIDASIQHNESNQIDIHLYIYTHCKQSVSSAKLISTDSYGILFASKSSAWLGEQVVEDTKLQHSNVEFTCTHAVTNYDQCTKAILCRLLILQ